MIEPKEQNKSIIPAEIIKRCNTYKHWQLFWFVLHYVVGIGAVIAGGLATLATAEAEHIPLFIKEHAWLFGLLSGFFGSIVTFLRPLKIAETYKQAYYKLSTAILRFQMSESSMRRLLNEFEESQNLVLQKDKDIATKNDNEENETEK